MIIKATLVSPPSLNEIPEFESLYIDDLNEANETSKEVPISETMTIEVAIKSCLQNFFEKRRASGDARPCGPHDMGPIYQAVFGITKEDLKDEKFLSRMRRTVLASQKRKRTIRVRVSLARRRRRKGRRARLRLESLGESSFI